jgi:hypothetical protein
MIPTLAIVGTVLVLTAFILTLIAYATLKDPELNVLFYTLLIGLGIGFAMCLIRISDLLNAELNKAVLNPSVVTFYTCPNYWVMSTDPKSGNQMCTNNISGTRIFVEPVANGTAANNSFNLTSINTTDNKTKCDYANGDGTATNPGFAWSEAAAKC